MAELIKAQDIEKTPIEINDDFTVDTNVDRRYVVKSSCSITLDDLTVSGITITILCDFATSDTCTVSYTGPDGSMTDTLAGGSFVKYIWGTSSWISEKTVKVSGKDDGGNTFSYDMVCRDSNGVNFDPYSRHTYSTQETWTGDYWIDGKKIYRKVYEGTTKSWTANTNDTQDITTSFGSTNQLKFFQGYILGNNGVYYPLPFDYIIPFTISGTVFGGVAQHISLWQAGNNFIMEAFLIPGDSINAFSNANYSIAVYYTKTTD